MPFNGAYLHLILNHLPVLLPIIGIILLMIGVVFNLRQTQIVGLAIIVVGALAALPTYFTGSAAKSVTQNYPQVTSLSIDLHQQAALYALLAIEIVGVFSLAQIIQFFLSKPVPRRNLVAVLVLAVVASLLVGRAAHLGGLIRHEEIERGSF